MYKRMGNWLVNGETPVGTFTDSEMIEYLIEELNEMKIDMERFSDYDDLKDEIWELEEQVATLESEIKDLEEL